MPAILRWREKEKKEKEDEVLSRDVARGRRTGHGIHVTHGHVNLCHVTPDVTEASFSVSPAPS